MINSSLKFPVSRRISRLHLSSLKIRIFSFQLPIARLCIESGGSRDNGGGGGSIVEERGGELRLSLSRAGRSSGAIRGRWKYRGRYSGGRKFAATRPSPPPTLSPSFFQLGFGAKPERARTPPRVNGFGESANSPLFLSRDRRFFKGEPRHLWIVFQHTRYEDKNFFSIFLYLSSRSLFPSPE